MWPVPGHESEAVMSEQKVADMLREVLADRKAIERKLNELIRDRHIEAYIGVCPQLEQKVGRGI